MKREGPETQKDRDRAKQRQACTERDVGKERQKRTETEWPDGNGQSHREAERMMGSGINRTAPRREGRQRKGGEARGGQRQRKEGSRQGASSRPPGISGRLPPSIPVSAGAHQGSAAPGEKALQGPGRTPRLPARPRPTYPDPSRALTHSPPPPPQALRFPAGLRQPGPALTPGPRPPGPATWGR